MAPGARGVNLAPAREAVAWACASERASATIQRGSRPFSCPTYCTPLILSDK